MAGEILRSEIDFGYHNPNDTTPDLAVGVAMVIRDGYARRLPEVPIEAIASTQMADIFDPEHVQATANCLRQGPEAGWYWALATHRHMGYVAVLGVALCMVYADRLLLAELHTHPEVQRRGVASSLALLAVEAAAQDPAFAKTGPDIAISLNVARQRPDDPTEHPASFYRNLGFVRIGRGADSDLGTVLPTDRMQAPLSVVLQNLRQRQAV